MSKKELPPKANGKKRLAAPGRTRLQSIDGSSPDIVVKAVELFSKAKVKTIKFNDGMSAEKFLKRKEGAPVVTNKIIGSLMELMILDVINGDIVYFNKKLNSSFSVNSRPILSNFFKGKSHKGVVTPVPKLDVAAAGFKYPIIVFDPGREGDRLMLTVVPRFLYALLTDNINNGKRYIKSSKEYILNTLNRKAEWNDETRKSEKW